MNEREGFEEGFGRGVDQVFYAFHPSHNNIILYGLSQ
jgi:hypothetical protein